MRSVVRPAGNFDDKYNTRNPVARRLMQGFPRCFGELVELADDAGSAFELDCGQGKLPMRLARARWFVRGRCWRDFGNTPGHVRHWSRTGFLELLGSRFDAVAVRSPLPWTMALCRPRR